MTTFKSPDNTIDQLVEGEVFRLSFNDSEPSADKFVYGGKESGHLVFCTLHAGQSIGIYRVDGGVVSANDTDVHIKDAAVSYEIISPSSANYAAYAKKV